MSLGVGDVVVGKVTGITKYGAFVSLPEGKSGMVHISEISYKYVSDINEHISMGQEVKVKVIGIDDAGRINLSIKKTEEPPRADGSSFKRNNAQKSDVSFEDRLKRFMQDSESRLTDAKKQTDRKGKRRKSGG